MKDGNFKSADAGRETENFEFDELRDIQQFVARLNKLLASMDDFSCSAKRQLRELNVQYAAINAQQVKWHH